MSEETVLALVVEDDVFSRRGLCDYLRLHHFDVAEAGDQHTAWEQVQRLQPRVVILDLVIPESPGARAHSHEIQGLRLAQQIRASSPHIAIVLLSACDDHGAGIATLIGQGDGGTAYLLKGCPAEVLLQAISVALQGRVMIDPQISQLSRLAQAMLARLDALERYWVEEGLKKLPELSSREWVIAGYVRRARTVKAIAQALNLTDQTVENTISRIYKKLRLNSAPPELRPLILLVKILQLNDLIQVRP